MNTRLSHGDHMSASDPSLMQESILSFWFVESRPWQWFRQSDQFDGRVKQRFGGLTEQAQRGELLDWEWKASSCLALVLLLDQFSRQVWRDSPMAYQGDGRALRLSESALQKGWIAAEPNRPRRQFWLMPMLHSESVHVVKTAIPLLERFVDSQTADIARRNLRTLVKFGYYPWRYQAKS